MMPRDPINVIDQLLNHIPYKARALRTKLEQARTAATYLPPEYGEPAWKEVTDALAMFLCFPPADDWEKEIQAIMKWTKLA